MDKEASGSLIIRKAEEKDISLILSFIKGIAEYEKLSHAVQSDEATLKESLFGKNPSAEVLLAYYDNEPAGFAVYFYNFSTFTGRAGMYLEDLFVKPHLRGKGIGKALLIYLADIAVERKCPRFEWSVLDWNKPAIEFYKSLGAKPMDEWTVYRLSGRELEELAKKNH